MSAADLIRPEVAALPSYNAGMAEDRFAEVYGFAPRAKLDSNENPMGASPAVAEAVRAVAGAAHRYPDASALALRTRLGAACGLSADRLIMGNGSEDLIGAAYRAVLRPGERVVTVCPSFGLHEFAALGLGASVTKVPFEPDWRFPVDGLIAALERPARILIFSSPSNPVGAVIPPAGFDRLVAAMAPGTLLIFDEAYHEYVSGPDRFDLLARLAGSAQPWLVLRTFSKAYGLAGLRIGYGAACDAGLAAAMLKTRNPFTSNIAAIAAAGAALSDPGHLARTVGVTAQRREALRARLTALGLRVAPSQANFLFVDVGRPAAEAAEALRRAGVLVKAWQEEPYTTHLRITVGTEAENDLLADALSRF